MKSYLYTGPLNAKWDLINSPRETKAIVMFVDITMASVSVGEFTKTYFAFKVLSLELRPAEGKPSCIEHKTSSPMYEVLQG